jgi:hypothetical protein
VVTGQVDVRQIAASLPDIDPAEADTNSYPRGVTVSAAEMAAVEPQLRRHNFHGEWNYTVRP